MIVRLRCPICGLVDFPIEDTTYVIETRSVHADCACGLELINDTLGDDEVFQYLALGMELAVA